MLSSLFQSVHRQQIFRDVCDGPWSAIGKDLSPITFPKRLASAIPPPVALDIGFAAIQMQDKCYSVHGQRSVFL